MLILEDGTAGHGALNSWKQKLPKEVYAAWDAEGGNIQLNTI